MILLAIVQVAIQCILVAFVIGKRFIRKENIIAVILFSLIMGGLYPYLDIFGSLLIFAFVLGMFKYTYLKWIPALYYASTIMIGMILIDHITTFILGKVLDIDTISSTNELIFSAVLLHQFITLIIGIIFINLWKKITFRVFEKDAEDRITKRILAFLGLFTYTIYFTMIVYVRLTGNQNTLVLMNTLYLFIYFVIFAVSLSFLVYTFRKQLEMREKEIELNSIQMYTEQLEKNYYEMRTFRHDYINILSSMSEYINNRDMNALESYFNDNIMRVSQEIRDNDFKMRGLSEIKIPEVKGLVSSKLITAQEKGIDVVFECPNEIHYLNMDSVLLCRCIGIILDNAIEAAEEVEKGIIRVGFVELEQSVSFVVWNTFCDTGHKLFQYFEKGFSTKGENRGLGLNSLKKMVDQENMTQLDTVIEDGFFKQEIVILK
ncbi:GHKL domain-containing protein [Lysinibacillus fusiformis]|uniref:sensor histidine kinase n=1 Tax=Lysinibacillus TaxID=400634 RepID=UPI0004D3DE43|nr:MULTISPECIES: GHKL domain-containing protein [Lysinibacillus]AJK86906.1 accessory gene regulator AgrC [Lysinibacillus fusiformis]KGA81410.1 accessory gene regulator AgrC [Lysinibacillus fusiformis]KHK56961.1 accessory gene regulator AgrC [Lysinibacillus sp. A1]MCE4044790.1 GHKL domain-containing protein [Lysinibacillus fusiformis]MCK1988474.1 GHKL domain-containing protein [Lysinibacillus fusiformis]